MDYANILGEGRRLIWMWLKNKEYNTGTGFVKGQRVNTSGFRGYTVSVTTSHKWYINKWVNFYSCTLKFDFHSFFVLWKWYLKNNLKVLKPFLIHRPYKNRQHGLKLR